MKPKEKSYKIERIFSDLGHTVVQLPPHMYYLNPIKLVWPRVKGLVMGGKVTEDLSLQKLTLDNKWCNTGGNLRPLGWYH
jgi:hypothetical protein